jgi:hypothetical protein
VEQRRLADVKAKLLSDFKTKLNAFGSAQKFRLRLEDAKKDKQEKQRKEEIDQAVAHAAANPAPRAGLLSRLM